MSANLVRYGAISLLAIALSACSSRYQTPVAVGGDDDDAVCQSRGYAQGSAEYAACRKDRDVQRNAATARADRRQRDLGEYMLNNPVRP
ncbi:hypothetical protein LPJ38_08795 [Bradyrhizobium daqingense]|uniref:Uncharacterized protein n=1 Tax=Bradyrhizobium daqingense TaxID=993502 RepID=A0A562KU73_9BRAD|nr:MULTISPECIES: hypothetical protein [Bradyrhizobium]MDQ8731152.1 hypothetical protein [Bradyrhizobium sp. LHD-71]TWH98917.1 hypothetical protein IQ17_05494 [Bradyrhizobium daqingense]UFS90810.1 hypothetical protein LPJ38_08795 [Bradyrhizobium daqingense]